MRIMDASLPVGSRSQTKIREKRVIAGIRQCLDVNMPMMKAEIAGLKGVKGPKIGG